LVQDHYLAVYRFAYRMSGCAADAEDLAQQTFLQAWRKIDQLREPERARSWLLSIVRNCFLKTLQETRCECSGGEHDWVVDPASQPPEELDEEELQRAVNELPEAYRTPVLLFYFEDLSYREIAKLLDVPIGTVMSRLSRGKEFLRSRLTESVEVAG
jgi:RNA polymerase sigma-70 factor (ECF subfamily)